MATNPKERIEFSQQMQEKYKNLRVLKETPHNLRLHTLIRQKETKRTDFIFYADQLNRTLMEFALENFSYKQVTVTTPTGYPFEGVELEKEVIGISIMRAGEAMETALRSTVRGARIGKVLIQRDESSPRKEAHLFYSKLPDNLEHSNIVLMDPMLATGSSAALAIKVLLEHGIKEEDITFVNLIATPEGLDYLYSRYPNINIVTTMIDSHLNSDKYIIPGIGDYGDRYFGT